MESGSDKTEAEEENAPIDGSGAGGTRPVNMDWDWGEGETGAQPSSHNSTTASEEGTMIALDWGSVVGVETEEAAAECASAGPKATALVAARYSAAESMAGTAKKE
ncbi:hypothetical protein P5673_006629 [Acropora cervicornis]|uniref:Uncharacterized protein n=1 Tax=Acropora cervicornis TaxID=6130 RepID=A0AAD9VC61_ACRCE|nr:hypothetical protein P5673_006629 [Acropora cervicornis]